MLLYGSCIIIIIIIIHILNTGCAKI